jgi:hypothetical protein
MFTRPQCQERLALGNAFMPAHGDFVIEAPAVAVWVPLPLTAMPAKLLAHERRKRLAGALPSPTCRTPGNWRNRSRARGEPPPQAAAPGHAAVSATSAQSSHHRSFALRLIQIICELNLRKQYVVIYLARAYAQIPLLQFTCEVLELEGQARQKALAKVRQMEQSLLSPLEDSS